MMAIKSLDLDVRIGSFHHITGIDFDGTYLRLFRPNKVTLISVIPRYDLDTGTYRKLDFGTFGTIDPDAIHVHEYLSAIQLNNVESIDITPDLVNVNILTIKTRGGLSVSFQIFGEKYER